MDLATTWIEVVMTEIGCCEVRTDIRQRMMKFYVSTSQTTGILRVRLTLRNPPIDPRDIPTTGSPAVRYPSTSARAW
jgi:hypothetical protein